MFKAGFYLIFLFLLLQACSNSKMGKYTVSYSELQTNCDASLRGLHVVNENVLWASGSGGTVLLSTDGGESWAVNQIAGAEKNDFRSIHAWDEYF